MSNLISRRDVIVNAGKTLAGAALLATPLQAQYVTIGQKLIDGSAGRGAKPLFLAPKDTTDPAVHSLAENLFWTDILMEHAGFISLLMPSPELASQRARAEEFHRTFSAHLERARAVTLDRTNYASLNRATIELIKPFIDFKHSLLELQQSGRIHTMIWPSFYDHTTREEQRAGARLSQLASGETALDGVDVVAFWSGIMSDHAEFIAHLLDPSEGDLVATALDSAAQFKGFQHNAHSKKLQNADIMIVAEELIDFKTAMETGIETGAIRSIIPPKLADHVRREALKFVDELKRAGFRT